MFESRHHSELVESCIEAGLRFGGRDVSDGFEQAAVVEPVVPFEGGELDGLQAAPWPAPVDHLGLEEADYRLAGASSKRLSMERVHWQQSRPSRLLKKPLISVYCRVPARYRGPSRSFGRGVWGRFLNSVQRAEEIATQNANQNQARPRQPNVLPIFGQLEAQSGKSQIRCENLLSSSKICCASYTLCVA